MRLPPNQPAIFLRRLNRFAALVRVAGQEVQAHVPNSGRLRELLAPGHTVYLTPQPGEWRKKPYDLTLVRYRGHLVGVDARLPPSLLAEAIAGGAAPEMQGYAEVQREVRLGASRIDLALREGGRTCYVEVKSSNLVIDGVAAFPDAPTERGRRHVLELARAVRQGHRAAVVFVIQRTDARAFRPYDETDPDFGRALRRAARQGVEAYAYRCRVTRRSIAITERVPVLL